MCDSGGFGDFFGGGGSPDVGVGFTPPTDMGSYGLINTISNPVADAFGSSGFDPGAILGSTSPFFDAFSSPGAESGGFPGQSPSPLGGTTNPNVGFTLPAGSASSLGSSSPFGGGMSGGLPSSPSFGGAGNIFGASPDNPEGYGLAQMGGTAGTGNPLVDTLSSTLGQAGNYFQKNPLAALMLAMKLKGNTDMAQQNQQMLSQRNQAIQQQQQTLAPLQQQAAGTLQGNGQLTAGQKSNIDSQIDQQIEQIKGQILTQAVQSGMGADSIATKQQVAYAVQKLNDQRQNMYLQQQQQNMQNALSQLGMSTGAIGQTINQMQQLPTMSATADNAAALAQLTRSSGG